MVNVMETGKAAPTWLDTHLDSDERWADGVPTDTTPWIADAFADLATLTAEELASRAVALDETTSGHDGVDGAEAEAVMASDVDVVESVDVDEWLTDAAGFTDANDVAFVVDDADLADADAPSLIGDVDVPRSGLADPFDALERQGISDADAVTDSATSIEDRSAPIPADDIVTAPGTDTGERHQPVSPIGPDQYADGDAEATAGIDALAVSDVFDFDDSMLTTVDDVDELGVDHVDGDGDVDGGSGAAGDDGDEWSDAPEEWADE